MNVYTWSRDSYRPHEIKKTCAMIERMQTDLGEGDRNSTLESAP